MFWTRLKGAYKQGRMLQSKIKSYQKNRSIKKGIRVLHGFHVESILLLYVVSVKFTLSFEISLLDV